MIDDSVICEEVINTIKKIVKAMGDDSSNVQPDTEFFGDLGFVKAFRRELAKPLNKIIRKHGGYRVSKDTCGKLNKVSDACELVIKQIKKASETK
ncbi:hypothetical protein [Candidatus Thiodiazotropha sp. CDECU1]|uniref:hypothetical protein n=1 Tax=Candidatus Thiodiazotropha sp. CDECU1 TaxID=3065865 RepID=UPI00292D9AF2|nr:hypothetical protein [Candidatus Thiodiazotropha sp. CDECU1]